MALRFESWSPSRWGEYQTCPAKAKYKILQKLCPKCFKGTMKGWQPASCDTCHVKEESSPALERGVQIHKAAEDYISGKTKHVVDALKSVKVLLNKLRADFKLGKVKVELEIAINRNWILTGYFDKNVWARFKLDVFWLVKKNLGRIIDWKTGKFHPAEDYTEQLEAYSLATISAGLAPEVYSSLVFTDRGDAVDSERINEKQLMIKQKEVERRIFPMFNDTKLEPKPGVHCRWCPYSKTKGGPCPY